MSDNKKGINSDELWIDKIIWKILTPFLRIFSFIGNLLPEITLFSKKYEIRKRYLKGEENCYCGSKLTYSKCHKSENKANKKLAIVISKINKKGERKEKFGFVSTEHKKPSRLVPEGFSSTGMNAVDL